MTEDKPQNKSIGFASGLALGTITAAGAVLLYKTKKGRKLRQILLRYYSDVNDHLNEVIKQAKKEAKKEAKKIKKGQKQPIQVVKKEQSKDKKSLPKRTKTTSTQRVFRRSGNPLIK